MEESGSTGVHPARSLYGLRYERARALGWWGADFTNGLTWEKKHCLACSPLEAGRLNYWYTGLWEMQKPPRCWGELVLSARAAAEHGSMECQAAQHVLLLSFGHCLTQQPWVSHSNTLSIE